MPKKEKALVCHLLYLPIHHKSPNLFTLWIYFSQSTPQPQSQPFLFDNLNL